MPCPGALAWAAGAASAGVTLAYQWIEVTAAAACRRPEHDRHGGRRDPARCCSSIGTWRAMGVALPIIAGAFLPTACSASTCPAPLNHRGYDFSQVIDHMTFGTEGVYGIPTYVSSSYIFLFILFGAFLEKAGMIGLFTDVAMGLFGHTGAAGRPRWR
jgi:hypothetical protein